MASIAFDSATGKSFVIIAFFLFIVLSIVAPDRGYAIQNCRDYTYWKLTGQDPKPQMKDPDFIRAYLVDNHYTKYQYTKVPALHTGDVLLFGKQHSGIIDDNGLVDSYYEVFVPVGPGPHWPVEPPIDPVDLPLQPPSKYRTGKNAQTVQQILDEHRYNVNQIEVWRKEIKPDKIHFVTASDAMWPLLEMREDEGRMVVKVVREGSGKFPVSARIESISPSAREGSRYNLSRKDVDWKEGETFPIDVVISVNDSDEEEGTQEITLNLKDVSGNGVLSYPSMVYILIKDKDMGGQISFDKDRYTVDIKDKSATLTVIRKGKFTKGQVSAQYTTADGTAKAGADYTAKTSIVTFGDADSYPQSFDVPVTTSQDTAPNATFTVTLSNPTNGAHVASPSTATVTIQGGTGQQVAFSQPVYDVQRSDGRATITVNRTGGSKGQLTVQYHSTNMTATAGTDYSAVSGQLTWGPGDSKPKTFEVPVTNIKGAWERKVARLILENPTNPDAPVQLGYQWQAELHITGDPLPTKDPPKTRSLIRVAVDPATTTLRPGGSVSFRATAIYNERPDEDVTNVAIWQPGPGNTYTAPPDQKDNLTVQVRATFQDRTGNAQVYVEVPSWSPPVSHADQTGMQARPATPDMYTWYALCRKVDGTVVYAERPDLTAYTIMGGPFEGARTAEWWINTNCASWLCQPTTGVCATAPRPGSTVGALGQESWYVLCDKKDGSILYGKNQDFTRYFTMAGPYVGAQDATLWIGSNCPSGRCNPGNGLCATGPQTAPTGTAGYYALCKRNTGEVVYSKSNDPTVYITIGGPFLTGVDAEQWISTAYPSWRCDPGTGRAAAGLPYATPPEVLAMFDQREQQHQQASRSGYGTTTTTTTTASGVTTTGATTTASSSGATGTAQPGTTQWPAGVPQPPTLPGTTGTATNPSSPTPVTPPTIPGTTTPVAPPTTPGTTTPVTPNQPVTPTPPVPTPTPTPVPTPTPTPASGSVVKWYVWHNCGTPGWWCVLMLTRTSENNLRAANKTLAILGSYDTEQQALQAMCPRMSGFYNGGALFVGPGVQGNIGSDKYCVKNFGWYDDAKKQWNCRQSKQ